MATKKTAPKPAAKKAAPTKKAAPKPAATKKAAPAKKQELANDRYPWLLNRFKSAIVDTLDEDKKKAARAALKESNTFLEAVDKASEFGFNTEPASVLTFVDDHIATGVTTKPAGMKQ